MKYKYTLKEGNNLPSWMKNVRMHSGIALITDDKCNAVLKNSAKQGIFEGSPF